MDKYKVLISEINTILKPYGFNKNGQTFFYKNNDGNVGVIDFQKARSSDASSTLFTINLGVYTNALKLFDSFDINSKPSVSDCHWRKRVGFLMPVNQDYWWEINENSNLSDLINEIANVLRYLAIPEIQKSISDEYLEKSWMEGISDGLTEQQMYLYLIAFLKFKNKPELQDKVKELKRFSAGKPFYYNIKENLEKIGITDV